jgi:hypothetical protein
MCEPPIIQRPPDIPLPDPSTYPEWYGEIWIKYPLSQKLFPSHFGRLFKAKAELRVILNEICFQHFGRTGPSPKFSQQHANNFHSRLRVWYRGLPKPLTPENIVLPSQLQLQYVMSHQSLLLFISKIPTFAIHILILITML